MIQAEFDLKASREARDEGMDRAAEKRKHDLLLAKSIAVEIAKAAMNQSCSINDVQHRLAILGIDLGNAAGSVFKGGEWERVGFGQAEKVSSHARVISVWRLKSV